VIVIAVWSSKVMKNWRGPVTQRQHDVMAGSGRLSLIQEGIAGAGSLLSLGRGGERGVGGRLYREVVTPPPDTAWMLRVRDLVCSRFKGLHIAVGDYDVDWDAWVGFEEGRKRPVVVFCHESVDAVRLGHAVEQLERRLRVLRFEVRWLLVTQGAEMRGELGVGVPFEAFTEDSLLDGLVDWTPYLKFLVERVAREPSPDSGLPLISVYVEPQVCVGQASEEEGVVGINSYMDAWLRGASGGCVALLGDYGQGKTTAAIMLAYRVASAKLRAALRGRANALWEEHGDTMRGYREEAQLAAMPTPIVIQLRGKSPRTTPPLHLVASWAVDFGFDTRAVMRMLEAGRAMVILEGFDEMDLVGNLATRFDHFRSLWQFASRRTKVMITGRPNYFLDGRELEYALNAGGSNACSIVYLRPLDVERIGMVVGKYSGVIGEGVDREIMGLVSSNDRFRELVSRPALLHAVVSIWESELRECDGAVDAAHVVGGFIRRAYKRQGQRSASVRLSIEERAYFMEGVAAYMAHRKRPNQIDAREFVEGVKDLLRVMPPEVSVFSEMEFPSSGPVRERLSQDGSCSVDEDMVDTVATEVRTGGVLVRDVSTSDGFCFSHRSYMEYLAAKVASDAVLSRAYPRGAEDRRASSLLAVTRIEASDVVRSPEMVKFFAELLVIGCRGSRVSKWGVWCAICRRAWPLRCILFLWAGVPDVLSRSIGGGVVVFMWMAIALYGLARDGAAVLGWQVMVAVGIIMEIVWLMGNGRRERGEVGGVASWLVPKRLADSRMLWLVSCRALLDERVDSALVRDVSPK